MEAINAEKSCTPPIKIAPMIIQRRTGSQPKATAAMIGPTTGPAPAIGGSTIVRAIDHTAQIVMEDHKLTDLKDNVREGETMAPKLPAPMQQAADTFFDPKNNPQIAANPRRKAYLENLGKRAIAGAFRSTALDVKGVLPDNRVRLRQAGTERLKQQ